MLLRQCFFWQDLTPQPYNSTFPFYTIQHGWIEHVKRVWLPSWKMLIQHVHSTPFNNVKFNMFNAFGHPVEWCWFNISIQHRSTLLNSICLTRLVTPLNDVDLTFPFNTVQYCCIEDVKGVSVGHHVWRSTKFDCHQIFDQTPFNFLQSRTAKLYSVVARWCICLSEVLPLFPGVSSASLLEYCSTGIFRVSFFKWTSKMDWRSFRVGRSMAMCRSNLPGLNRAYKECTKNSSVTCC